MESKERMRLKLIIALLIIGSSAFGQSMSVNWLKQSTFTAAGTNTYTVTATGVTQYVAGLELKILFTNANTGASTINVNALGARTLQKNGAALASGDIAAGGTYRLTFDGTNFQVLGIGGSGGGGGGSAWLLANGGTLTGANTISGAFNLGFTNNAVGVGVAPGSITANTRVDIRGPGTSSASSSLRVASSINTPVFRIRDDGAILHGINEQGITFDETGTSIYRPVTSSFTRIANDGTVGSQMLFYGSTHATRANRAELYTPLFHINNGVTGNVLIGGTTLTNANTILDVQSTTQGVALPRMTNTQRNAISSPYSGLQIHSTTSNRPNWHNGTAWQEAASRSDLGGFLTGDLTGDVVITSSSNRNIFFGDFFDNPNAFSVSALQSIALEAFPSAIIIRPANTEVYGILTGNIDHSGTITSLNYTQKSYVDSRLRAKTLPAPGAGQNGQSIRWNNTTDQWEYFTAAGGSTYYAPTSLVVHSSDAHYTAVANSVLHLPDGVLSANRTLTIPTGANGDVIEIYCNEDTHAWNLAGATVYLADRTTVVTQLLFNVPTLMQRINGLWIIKN